jgi:hypothetical protein
MLRVASVYQVTLGSARHVMSDDHKFDLHCSEHRVIVCIHRTCTVCVVFAVYLSILSQFMLLKKGCRLTASVPLWCCKNINSVE